MGRKPGATVRALSGLVMQPCVGEGRMHNALSVARYEMPVAGARRRRFERKPAISRGCGEELVNTNRFSPHPRAGGSEWRGGVP